MAKGRKYHNYKLIVNSFYNRLYFVYVTKKWKTSRYMYYCGKTDFTKTETL